MRPITVGIGPLAAATATALALAQIVPAGSAIALNGPTVSNGVATLDMPRRVAVTSAGNDSGITFAIVGTDRYGNAQRETLAGTNGATAQSALDYASVSSITPSAATAANVTAGTTGVASSAWIRNDEWAPGTMSAQIELAATAAFLLEQTFDDPNSPTSPVSPALVNWQAIETGTASGIIGITNAPIFLRLTMTSGTGSLRAVFVQYSSSNVSIDVVKG